MSNKATLLKFEDEKSYTKIQHKNNSVSIELKMIIDDASVESPFIRMFCIDEFRKMDYEEIEKIILGNSTRIARLFSYALRMRLDTNDELDARLAAMNGGT